MVDSRGEGGEVCHVIYTPEVPPCKCGAPRRVTRVRRGYGFWSLRKTATIGKDIAESTSGCRLNQAALFRVD